MTAGDFNPDSGTIQVRVAKSDKPRHIVLTAEGIGLFKALAAGKGKHALLLIKASGEPWKMSDQDRRMRAYRPGNMLALSATGFEPSA